MARTRNYKRIYRYPKQKWAPIIKHGNVVLNQGNRATILDLVINSSDTSTPTPVVIKVKHMKMQVDAMVPQTDATLTSTTCGVVFIPEGVTVTNATQLESLIASHPEWVMLFELVDAGSNTNTNTMKTSSPLSRNLNSGDRLCFFAWTRADSATFSLNLSYILKWVVRAN